MTFCKIQECLNHLFSKSCFTSLYFLLMLFISLLCPVVLGLIMDS